MRFEKKNITIIILTGLLIISGIGNTIFLLNIRTEEPSTEGLNTIIVGSYDNLQSIDPIDTIDYLSKQAEYQVLEGLVDYNYSDHPNYPIIPKLATNWYWHNASCISFKIRRNVYFHDGSPLDAYAVKWNFERLMWFCNYSGELLANETSWKSSLSYLYYFSDEISPIINRTKAINDYNFTVWLNKPFSPFLDLLTTPGTYICSPISTHRYRFLDLINEKLIGTGPFEYVRFTSGPELRFKVNSHYWGKSPWMDMLIFRIREDGNDFVDAAYNGEFDYAIGVENIITFTPYPGKIVNVGEDVSYIYLEFYCGPGNPIYSNPWYYQALNFTWRRALALALNSSYVLNEILMGYAVSGFPVISPSIPGYNDSVITASTWQEIHGYNNSMKKARELMQSMGFGMGWNTTYPGSDEDLWTTASFRTIKVNHHSGSPTSFWLNKLIETNWNLIGVNISITTRTWEEYLNTGENSPWEIECSYTGWHYDYLDAFNILDLLFNNNSNSCFSQINDPILKSSLEAAAKATDPISRQTIYKWIQSYIFDITRSENPSSCCHIPLWSYLVRQGHMSYLKGVAYNILEMLNCVDWYIES
jgi:peptide/nickel transport system substrate-binding protein